MATYALRKKDHVLRNNNNDNKEGRVLRKKDRKKHGNLRTPTPIFILMSILLLVLLLLLLLLPEAGKGHMSRCDDQGLYVLFCVGLYLRARERVCAGGGKERRRAEEAEGKGGQRE